MRILWAGLLLAIAASTVAGQQDEDYWYSDLQFDPDYEWYPDLNVGTLSNGDKEPAEEASTSDENSAEKLLKNGENEEKQVEEDITNFMNKLGSIDDYQFEDNRSEAKEQQAVEVENELDESGNDGSVEAKDNEEEEVKEYSRESLSDNDSSPVEQDKQNVVDTLVEPEKEDQKEKFAEELATIQKESNWRAVSDASYETDEESSKGEISKELLDELNNLFKTAENDSKDNEEIFEEKKSILADNKSVETELILESDENKPDVKNDENNGNQEILDETRAILNEAEKDDDTFAEEEKSSEVKSHWENIEALDNILKPLESVISSEKNENENLQDILNETKDILNEDVNYDDISSIKDVESLEKHEPLHVNDDIIEVTKQILKEIDESSEKVEDVPVNSDTSLDDFDENILNKESKSDESESDQDDEDTVDQVYADLDDDLKQLFETWAKLAKDETKESGSVEDVLQYEEKYGKPYKEDIVLSQREDYDDSIDSIEEDKKEKDNSEDKSIIQAKQEEEVNNDETNESSAEEDALEQNINTEIPEKFKETISQDDDTKSVEDAIALESTKFKTLSVDQLNAAQYDDLMRQFKDNHMEALTESDKIGSHVAPIHMTIFVDKATEITSPNYPSPYPTNNIIDWIFDGEGRGIELNITDFAINGLFEDYLLVIPGGIDNSRTDGLLFSHQLNEKRTYRFLDVDRLFVRFVSNPGMSFFRGFKFSVRLIASVPEEVEAPEPEVQLPAVPATLTLNLGGVTAASFRDNVREEFRRIVADMATMYINANSIEPGLNTTFEVTQITSVTLCNVDWPNFENCAQVKFGVPIVRVLGEPATKLTEDDLTAMWNTYTMRASFTLRLRRLGITEFDIPNDGHMMLVWLVIAVGVLISVTMLAFALWRFSCFEDYTRMAAYSDTDSISNEKRGLDLYPTPHQTLPPLFAENEYKWDDGNLNFDDTTRVDIGGYANRSYVRDDLYDMESDEEVVVAPRDRFTTDV